MVLKRVKSAYEVASENTWARAGIQLIPVVGSALDVLLFDKAGKLKEQRAKDLISDLSAAYAKLEQTKIDHGYLSSEEYLEVFEKSLSQITYRAEQVMRQAITNGLVNITLESFKSMDKPLLSSILSSLSSAKHIKLLLLCNEIQKTRDYRHINLSDLYKKIGTYGNKEECNRVRNQLEYLTSFGLVDKEYDVEVDVSDITYEGDASASGDISATYSISKTGQDLLKYISEPSQE